MIAFVLFATALVADVVLFLQRGGEVLRGWELAAIIGLAALAVVATILAAEDAPLLLIIPIVALVAFRFGLTEVLTVPADAVLRDAQAGLAVVVVVGGQLALIVLGLALAPRLRRRPSREGEAFASSARRPEADRAAPVAEMAGRVAVEVRDEGVPAGTGGPVGEAELGLGARRSPARRRRAPPEPADGDLVVIKPAEEPPPER